jgi:hypothetical protein
MKREPVKLDAAFWIGLFVVSPLALVGAGILIVANVAIVRVIIDAVSYLL